MHHGDGLRLAQTELDENAAAGGGKGGKVDVYHHFVAAHNGAAHALIEIAQRNGAFTSGRSEPHAGVQGHQGRDGVVGGAGGDDVAGNRGPIANLRRTHFPTCLRQRQSPLLHQGRSHHLVVRDQWPQVNLVGVIQPDAVQVWDARDVNQYIQVRALAPFYFQQQVCAAGNQTRARAMRRQQRQRVWQRGGRQIMVNHGGSVVS